MSDSGMRWRAECEYCPTSTDPGYGHQVKVNHEADDEHSAYVWVSQHVRQNPDHHPTVDPFIRAVLTLEYVDPAVMRALFGNPDGGAERTT